MSLYYTNEKKTFLNVFHKLKSKNLDQYLSDFAKKKKNVANQK